jgi:hypothetical protein
MTLLHFKFDWQADLQQEVLPMLYLALQSNMSQVQVSTNLKGPWHDIFDLWFFFHQTTPAIGLRNFLNMAVNLRRYSTMKSPILYPAIAPLCTDSVQPSQISAEHYFDC